MHFAEKFHIKQETMNSLQSVIHHLRKVLTYDKRSGMIVELSNESHNEVDVKLLNVSYFNFSCISRDESDVAEYTFHEGSDDDDESHSSFDDDLDDEFHFSYTSLVNPLKAITPIVDSKLAGSIVNSLNWFFKAWFNDGD
jgi:hypothetical protein